jgi:hypothetical protein
MPDVSSIAPAEVRRFVVFDVHKNSLVAGVLPAAGGAPEVAQLEKHRARGAALHRSTRGPRGLGPRL